MLEMDWLNIISNGCILFTIIMFATGIPQCLQMMRKKSTANIPYLPYLMTNVNNIAWIIYGQMTNNFTLILVNVVGSVLQTMYMSIYVYVAKSKEKELKQTVFAGAAILIGWFVTTRMLSSLSLAIHIVGMISCGITMLMFASPLAEIKTVITEKSTATISFPLTVASMLCASMWTMFGMLLKDSFIMVPNIVGVLTSVIRFYLFCKFPQQETLPV